MRYVINNYKAGPFGSSLITEKLQDDGDILVYTPENIAAQNADLNGNMYLPNERKKEMSQFFVQKDDIIFPIVGSLGRAMIITEEMPRGIINQRLARFSISSENILPDFFMWLFGKSSFYSTFIDLKCRGSIIVNLTKAIILDMPVLIPDKSEQKAISSYLNNKVSEIIEIIADIQSQIDTLEQYKRSIIIEAVTKGLNPDAEMRDSGIPWIGEIPKNWRVDKLKFHLMRYEPRNPGNKSVLSLYRDFGVIPKDTRDDNHNVTSEDTSNYKYVRPGNLVINKMKAWQGSVAVSDYEGIVSPAYFVYKFTDNSYHKRYFHYLLRSCYKDEFMRLSSGIRVSQWDLPSAELDNIQVIIPPISEQCCIAKFLDARCTEIEDTITMKKAQLTTLADYKNSLIFEYVTGKKEVPAS